jgi:ankyrin repeat protein
VDPYYNMDPPAIVQSRGFFKAKIDRSGRAEYKLGKQLPLLSTGEASPLGVLNKRFSKMLSPTKMLSPLEDLPFSAYIHNPYENGPVYPCQMDQEMNAIIDSNSCAMLHHFLKTKSPAKSIEQSMFYYACKRGKYSLARHFIEVRKFSPHMKISDGFTHTGRIFKAVAKSGNLALVKYFVDTHNVEIECQGLTPGTQDTALSQAAAQGHAEVVEYLLSKGANPNPEVANSDILDKAIDSKNIAVVKLLVEAGSKLDSFHLDRALKAGSLDITKYFLEIKPMHEAHWYTSSAACSAVKSGNISLVKYLEEHENLDIFAQQNRENVISSLLCAAAESGSIEMLKFLLDERQIQKKISGNEMEYAPSLLNTAVKKKNPQALSLVRFLMEERQFHLPKDPQAWKSILYEAQFSSIEMKCYLQSYVCDSAAIKDTLLAIAYRGLDVQPVADLWKLFNLGLFRNDIHGHIQERKISLDQLKNTIAGNKEVMTQALFYYSEYYFNSDLSILKLLVELGADLNAENHEGIAAIHLAIHSGGINDIVQFYIAKGADLSKTNRQGKSAESILDIHKQFNTIKR